VPTDDLPILCILTELKNGLNFTEYHYRLSQGGCIQIDMGKPPGLAAILFLGLLPHNVNNLLTQQSVSFMFLNHGMKTTTRCFGTGVTPKNHSGLDGLLKPFGGTTWLCLTLSVAALMAFQRVLNHTGRPEEQISSLYASSFCCSPNVSLN